MPRDYREEIINSLERELGIPPSTEQDLQLVDLQATINTLHRTVRTNQETFGVTATIGEPVPTETRIEPLMPSDYGTEPATPVAGYNVTTIMSQGWTRAHHPDWTAPTFIETTDQPTYATTEKEVVLHDKELTALKEEVASLKAAIHALINTIDGSGLY